MFLNLSKTARWRKAFRAEYPCLEASAPETGRLRLILGVGRSGTTWTSQVLFKGAQPRRCFSEPLFHLTPRLPFHKEGDHTALGCQPDGDDALLDAYSLLTHRQFAPKDFKPLERNDPNWELCVVKEVHALLGTEGLLRAWKTPAVFILRDPVYVADSLFAAQTLDTIYLDHELEAVRRPEFLARFVPQRHEAAARLLADAARQARRPQVILGKTLCIQLLQEMFGILAGEFPCAHAVRYEKLCESPREMFGQLAGALAIPWHEEAEGFLHKTVQADATSNDPYSIMRNTSGQKSRPFKFLSVEEVALCREAVAAIASAP